jgi:hypothetical protein
MTKKFNQPQQQPFAAMHFVDEAEKKSQRNAEATLKKEAEKTDKKALASERKAQRNAEAVLKKEEAVQRQFERMLKAEFGAWKKAVREAQKKAEADEIKAHRQWESNLKKAAREAQKKAQAAEVEAMKSARTLAQIDI